MNITITSGMLTLHPWLGTEGFIAGDMYGIVAFYDYLMAMVDYLYGCPVTKGDHPTKPPKA